VQVAHMKQVPSAKITPQRAMVKTLELRCESPSILGQKIKPSFSLNEVSLPDDKKSMLKEIINQASRRLKGYSGVRHRKISRLGSLKILFSGDIGTGKIIVAMALAYELGFSMYRIDLSKVVSK
jgi:SpoVK/Ycf46/Vps4 family AAA+-type ATPase